MHTIFVSTTLKILSSLPFDSQKLVSKNKANNINRHDAKRARKRTGSACAKWAASSNQHIDIFEVEIALK